MREKLRNKNMKNNQLDAYLPHEAKIIDRIQESSTIFTLKLSFTDSNFKKNYKFKPGQFNMLYLYGAGEVAISIASDPDEKEFFEHTIRVVGRITEGLAKLPIGDRVGIRGPFGRGWPIMPAEGKDIVIVTGGLGCAPVVSMINYILLRRDHYGALKILQGVKHSDDFIFKKRYEQWRKMPETEIYIAADKSRPGWPWYTGRITEMISDLSLKKDTVVMMCGPQLMMSVAIKEFLKKQLNDNNIYLSMERNMECAIGHCGHCQYGGLFVCKNGPVFSYNEVKNLFAVSGF